MSPCPSVGERGECFPLPFTQEMEALEEPLRAPVLCLLGRGGHSGVEKSEEKDWLRAEDCMARRGLL